MRAAGDREPSGAADARVARGRRAAAAGALARPPALYVARRRRRSAALRRRLRGAGAAWPSLVASARRALAASARRLQATLRLGEALAPALEGRDLAVTGVIASLPQVGPNGIRFRFAIDAESRRHELGTLPRRIALGWYGGFHEDAALSAPQRELKAGQRWRFTVRLRRPHGNLNPHGFDYELQLFEQGVRATGYVRDAPAPQMLGEGAGFPVERLRQRVRDAIYAAVPERRAAGVLAALAVGDQGAIEREDWERFRNTGVAHLMSISGLHITMFAWLAASASARSGGGAAARLLGPAGAERGALGRARRRRPRTAVFSGWGVPAQRTIWMLGRGLPAAGRGPALALAAGAARRRGRVTLLDPVGPAAAGFWLSFAAVGLLLASTMARPAVAGDDGDAAPSAEPARPRRSPRPGAALRTQLVATLGLTPLTLVFFQQVSLVGLLANLVAIPVVTLG
jgi:competence protein ComEC